MSTYDFRTLSSLDFEELTRDLLQEEWGVHIESFKEGKDQGIDLRYSPLKNQHAIIQCKHYIESGFKALLRDLKQKELPKIQHLSLLRYILVTSVPLTPLNKSAIQQALNPFIQTPADIFGQNDVNNLLSKFQNIETQHFKLWLTSTAVLNRVLKNAVLVQSDFKIEKIISKLPLYVQTNSLRAALKLLDNNNFLVISGIPGIGKTTLAEILLYVHLEKGYSPIQVTENIKEAFDLYHPDQKQIFYYDDFLGQTMLHDRFGKNEDAALIEFIDLIHSHKNARLIMTTREYILQSANLKYEKLAASGLESAKYILTLSDYTRKEKAKILYNHIYFSQLPRPYIDVLLANKFYFEIILHHNFSPRIIEWMASLQHIYGVSAEQYQGFFRKTLDHPEKLWSHAFENQIEPSSQILLLALYSLAPSIHIEVLREAFSALQDIHIKRYNLQANPKDFMFALKELEGAFTATKRRNIVEFHNPSVKDFLELKLSHESAYVDNLLLSAVCFKQVYNLWHLSKELHQSKWENPLHIDSELLIDAIERTLKNDVLLIERHGGISTVYYIDTGRIDRARIIIEIYEALGESRLLELCIEAVDNTIDFLTNDEDEYDWEFDFQGLKQLIAAIDLATNLDYELQQELMDKMRILMSYGLQKVSTLENLKYIDESMEFSSYYWWTDDDRNNIKAAFNHYLDHQIWDECSDMDNSTLLETLADDLSNMADKYEIDVSATLGSILEQAEECAEREQAYADEHYDPWKEQSYLDSHEIESIEDMFNTLKDR